MDPVDNPYSPGAGLRPAVLAGRDDDLVLFDTALRRAELDRPSRSIMLTGLRGVGKTVLLNEFAERASNADWMTIQLEVRPKSEAVVLTTLAARLSSEIRRKAGGRLSDLSRRALRSVKALSMTIDPTGAVTASIDIDATPSGDIEVDLAALAVDAGTAARELGTGVAVFVDELQDLDKAAMASLAAAAHAAGQRSVPFLVVGAGLPNLPGRFAEAKSYSERLFDYRMLDKLSDEKSRKALADPASSVGVKWDDDALTQATEASGGYPYFLQEFGSAAWLVAAGPQITAHDANNGVRLGRANLDIGFFRARWERATSTEREYLRAMAVDGDEFARTPDVANRMNRSQSNVGPIRAGLIGKGLIYAPEYGTVAFTVPGMAEFIRRQDSE